MRRGGSGELRVVNELLVLVEEDIHGPHGHAVREERAGVVIPEQGVVALPVAAVYDSH
eukprot:CAMPEP_0168615960 /NCGR_PEP_ID=MMETSP0449_2-20121227/4776_1 /TAXON_ID=1082188 /ORGANISM="Strombidium rassoulzadegani, Strain ras09" /LENGTH=57 /DNA_ID=CAMNT_0008656721 /DNA_START=27 /DNA_END=200 /DNA_ORIENTATION=-